MVNAGSEVGLIARQFLKIYLLKFLIFLAQAGLQDLILSTIAFSNRKPTIGYLSILKIGALIQQKSDPLYQTLVKYISTNLFNFSRSYTTQNTHNKKQQNIREPQSFFRSIVSQFR